MISSGLPLHHRALKRPTLLGLALALTLVSACGGNAAPPGGYTVQLTCASSPIPVWSFDGMTWSAAANVGMNTYTTNGFGIATLPDGRGLVVTMADPANPSVKYSIGTGADWSSLMPFAVEANAFEVVPPVANATHAFAVVQNNSDDTLMLATFDDASSTWSNAERTGLSGEGLRLQPVVIPARTGTDAMVMGSNDSTAHVMWVRRTAGAWSAPVAVPGMTTGSTGVYAVELAAVRRAGTDDVVAVLPSGAQVVATTFSQGAWSSLVAVGDDLAQPQGGFFRLAALRDGRVALAYVNGAGNAMVGFFDGTRWGEMRPIPSVEFNSPPVHPIDIAAPHDQNAVLEFVYHNHGGDSPIHLRLLDEHAWTWSAPAMLPSVDYCGGLSLSTTPVL